MLSLRSGYRDFLGENAVLAAIFQAFQKTLICQVSPFASKAAASLTTAAFFALMAIAMGWEILEQKDGIT